MKRNKSVNSAEKFPLVSLIVPVYRSEFYMKSFIKSLQKTNYPNFEVILVFDPPFDKGLSIAYGLIGKDKRWRIIENQLRLGSTKSLNLAINEAKGELFAFISCDITVDPNWMSELVCFLLNSDDKVGAAIAKFLDYHKHDLIQVYRLFLSPQTGWIVSPALGEKDGIQYSQPIEGFNGFEGLVVKKSVFAKAGLFDEDIDALIYDLDMSWRLWLAGFRMVTVPSAKVHHWSLKVGRQNAKWEFFYGKMINLFIQNYSLPYLIKYLPQLFLIFTFRAFYLLAKGNSDAIVGWGQALLWTILNLPRTLRKRHHIQTRVRAVSDNYLSQIIFSQYSLWGFLKYLKNAKRNITPKLLNKDSNQEKTITYSA